MSFVPHTSEDRQEMLEAIGASSVEELFSAIPESVRFPKLDLPPSLSEMEANRKLNQLASRNMNTAANPSFLGAGIYNHYSPATVYQILWRGEFHTAYTPYQPEVAQGTLQVIYEFQSMISALTNMDVSNASLYDGATALAEGALLAVNPRKKRTKVVVAGTVHPHYRGVLRTYTTGLDIEVVELPIPAETLQNDPSAFDEHLDDSTACLIVQYPNFFGRIEDLAAVSQKAHDAGAKFLVSAYPLALGMLPPPGDFDADIVTGEGQSLGVPQSLGGPVVGILAAKQELVRQLPGRLAGMSVDEEGKRGYVLALQTREQHIRREKATSNICTNQGLLALAATVYLASVGPTGLKKIAEMCYQNAHYLADRIDEISGFEVVGSGNFFNEFAVKTPVPVRELNTRLQSAGIIGGYDLGKVDSSLDSTMLICTTEMNNKEQIDELITVLKSAA
ncbi:MAG: aminomethyl-transferring glycine dehydrogenase subunit GcvPA [Thermomicrobiaceae bacterium]